MLYTLAVILLIAWLLGVVGTYTIGATVATIPSVTCSQPGHQLPQ